MALNKKVAIEVEIKNIEKISKLKKELKAMRAEMKATEKLTADGTKLGKAAGKQYSETAKGVKRKSTELRNLNKNIRETNNSSKKITKSSNGMAKQFIKGAAAIGIIVTAFRTVSRVIGSVISTFSEFEFVMAKVKAVSGATNEEFKQLKESAQDLGRTTFFTASQVGELQLNFSKLGFTAEEIMQAQEATLNLATATGSDLARSAIVAGAAVRGFGLDASETGRVVDVMAVSFASSALDIEKWQTSMTKVAPIAKSAGFSIEDTAAIMAKLADSGIEASIAGTSLRNILLKMQDPNSKLTKAFGKTIHGLDDLVPAMKAFVAQGGSMADVMEVVDIRQAGAFEQMLSTTDATLELRDALLQANGEGERMALIVGDNLQGAWLRFKSAIQGLSIVLVDFIAVPFTNMINSISTGINNITLLAEGFDSLNEKIVHTAKNFLKEQEATELLVEEYARLDGITEKTKEEKIRFGIVTKELEANIGDSVKIIDKETGALVLNAKALDLAIARHALLADGEAVKLVHQLNKVNKEIDNNTDTLGENNNVISQNQLLLNELTKTQADKIINNRQLGNQQKMLNAEGQIQENTIGNVNKLNNEQRELDVKIIKLKQKNIPILNKNIELDLEKASLIKMLNELGYDEVEINALVGNSIKKVSEELEENTKSILANTAAKKEETELEKVKRRNLQIEVGLQQQVLDGKMTQKAFDDEFTRLQIKNINSVLDNEVLSNPIRLALIKQRNDLMLKGMKTETNERQEQIKGIGQLGSQLINLAGDDKKYQKVREAGIKISAAAALATNAESLALQMKGLSADIAKGFPFNIIAIASTLALLMSMKQNFSALTGGKFEDGGIVDKFADGGMVQGRSHAQGGEKFAVGGRVAELEGGEAVINKRSTAMFKGQLSAMNSAGGGVKFADGGLMNMPSFASSQFDAMGQQNMMGAMNQSSKVVVVEADITTSQNTVGVIEAEATF